ncbi:MAG: hypothetical protein ACYTG0_05005 [Planctomycetota bacterium]|jgi:phage shock protein A
MLRKALIVTAAVTTLTVLGALVLGPSHLLNLLVTQCERLKEESGRWVDPAVELASAMREAERELPKHVASLKLAIEDADKELATQVRALKELEQATTLIEKDLRVLAPAVLQGTGGSCELHGRTYAPEEAKGIAQRLINKKRQYADLVAARRNTIERLRGQRCRLDGHLAEVQQALADVTTNTKHVKSKIALVKANEKIAALQGVLRNGEIGTQAASALQQLERRLDARLLESEAKTQFRRGLAATDRYVSAVREEEMHNELQRYGVESSGSEEAAK